MDFFSVDVRAVVDDPYVRHNLLVLKFSQIVSSLKHMNVDAASTEVGVKSLERQDLQIRTSGRSRALRLEGCLDIALIAIDNKPGTALKFRSLSSVIYPSNLIEAPRLKMSLLPEIFSRGLLLGCYGL